MIKYLIICFFMINGAFSSNSSKKEKLIIKSIEALSKSKKIKLHPAYRQKLAKTIHKASNQFLINPKIMISIMFIESHFKQFAVSSTKDYSIAQISLHQWNKNKSLKKTKHLLKSIKKDPFNAIYVMGEILSIKRKEGISDPEWYLRYHSNTKKYKDLYRKKFNKTYLLIKDIK